MKASRDKLFGNLIKKTVKREFPPMSLAYLAGLEYAPALTAFAGALLPTIPDTVDFVTSRRDARRKNSLSYLIGVK
jgi:hypothetical protein